MKLHNYLEYLLSIKRPSGGAGVERARRFICEIIEDAGFSWHEDDYGNIICTTEFNGTIYSSHIDTVHWAEGTVEVRMDEFGIVTGWSEEARRPRLPRMGLKPVTHALSGKKERDILGADDAAGIYIMLRMIETMIPGTYIFHADEELGCVGSKAIADGYYSVAGYDLLDDFTHAIAFDRKGTSDIVHNQLNEDMASSACTQELAFRLAENCGLRYKPAKGMVTDTAMYADYVQECFNLSVGYYDEHTEDERLDYGHLEQLLDGILSNHQIFDDLPVVRDLPDDNVMLPEGKSVPETMTGLCHEYPAAVADLLVTLGYDYDELFNQLNQMDILP